MARLTPRNQSWPAQRFRLVRKNLNRFRNCPSLAVVVKLNRDVYPHTKNRLYRANPDWIGRGRSRQGRMARLKSDLSVYSATA